MADRRVELTRDLYAALAAGDLERLPELLTADFVGRVTPGLGEGIGGEHHGFDAMWERCWARLGRASEVAVEVGEWIPCTDGRLLVTGVYRARGRRTGGELVAAFTHILSFVEAGERIRIAALSQLTDSALWNELLAAEREARSG